MNLEKLNLKRAYEVSTKGLYQDDQGRFLLIRDEDGYWELPGGGLDHGEEIIEGLKRECLEELGVECRILDQDPFKVWVGKTPKGVLRSGCLISLKFLR
jgi:8-oxo-dGTP pyrophosphatase MutT (NUDIX family)